MFKYISSLISINSLWFDTEYRCLYISLRMGNLISRTVHSEPQVAQAKLAYVIRSQVNLQHSEPSFNIKECTGIFFKWS